MIKELKVEAGAVIMLALMLWSDRHELFLLFGLSALLHEMGHLAAARSLGITVREIRVGASGIRICTDNGIISYKKEIILAAAGPFANLCVITLIMITFLSMRISVTHAAELCEGFLVKGEYSHVGALGFCALASFMQAALNLLPVRTYDGGRIAYSASAILFGSPAAERIIDIFSVFSAFILWTVALYLMLKISSGLGIYIFSIGLFLTVMRKGMSERSL